MIIEEQFNEIELNIIFEALGAITIQGKNARMVADLIDKIRGGIGVIQSMKVEEQLQKMEDLEKIKKTTQK
jgi:hypothetical protein